MIEIDWADFKDFVDSRNVSLQWIDVGKFYYMRALDGTFMVACNMRKNGSADQTDFETNYKNKGKDNRHPLSQVTQTLAEDDLTLRAQGTTFTVPFGTTHSELYLCSLAYALNGGSIYTENAVVGDSITIDIYDKDNVLGYGTDFPVPGTEFVSNWSIYPGKVMEIVDLSVSYLPAPGLYLRVQYISTGNTNVKVGMNYRLYEVN